MNKYVEFNNTESQKETNLLLQISTYSDALKQDGYINRSIPNTIEYRGHFYSSEKDVELEEFDELV